MTGEGGTAPPVSAADLVRRLYESYQRRDWESAARLLHPESFLAMPSTGEELAGPEAILRFQREYPEPWGTLSVKRAVGEGPIGVAEVEVVDPAGRRYAMAAFWQSDGERLLRGVEYWVTVGAERPPPGRSPAYPAEAMRSRTDRA